MLKSVGRFFGSLGKFSTTLQGFHTCQYSAQFSSSNRKGTIAVLQDVDSKLSAASGVLFDDAERIEHILANALERSLNVDELVDLISSDPKYWDRIKQAANDVKEQVFGEDIFYYAPVYFDSICVNDCVYCDFRRGNPNVLRTRLSFEEFKSEVDYVYDQDIRNIEVVSSTDPGFSMERLQSYVRYVKSLGVTVLMNNRPLELEEYKMLKSAGLDWSWLWMETYDEESYYEYHPSNEKSDFVARVEVYDTMGAAGLNIGFGTLLGLSPDWKKEVISTIAHAQYLKAKHGVDVNFGTSRFCSPNFAPLQDAPYPESMTDDKFTLMVALYRLGVKDAWINVSTREDLDMLKDLWRGGGSLTNPMAVTIPGGYTCGVEGAQFEHFSFSVEIFDEELGTIGLNPRSLTGNMVEYKSELVQKSV